MMYRVLKIIKFIMPEFHVHSCNPVLNFDFFFMKSYSFLTISSAFSSNIFIHSGASFASETS